MTEASCLMPGPGDHRGSLSLHCAWVRRTSGYHRNPATADVPAHNHGPHACRIKCPGHFTAKQAEEQCVAGLCPAIGHKDCRGGSVTASDGTFLNAFGKAFRDAGYQWTEDLCNADSDGDGRTNGEELGDPCCVWRPGQELAIDDVYATSHPGHAADTNSAPRPTPADCKALRAADADDAGSTELEAVDALFAAGEERRELPFKFVPSALIDPPLICS